MGKIPSWRRRLYLGCLRWSDYAGQFRRAKLKELLVSRVGRLIFNIRVQSLVIINSKET